MVIQGSFKVIYKMIKGVSSEFQVSFQNCLRKFQGYLVSSVFQENLNISIKFCFAIFFSHGSHRSYPSRRRACLGCLHFWGHLHFEVQVCHSSDEPSIICHIFLIIRYDGFVALIPLNDIFNEWCNNSKRQDREIERRQRSWHSDHSCTLCSCGEKRQMMPRDNYN